MKKMSVDAFQKALLRSSDLLISAEPELTRVDSLIGDGDHGTGIREGFSALKEMLLCRSYSDLGTLFYETGVTLIRSMGGASGVLFGTLFIENVDTLRNCAELDGFLLVKSFRKGVEGVMKRGRTQVGQKTMVDALCPALAAIEDDFAVNGQNSEIEILLKKAYLAALQGMEATRGMPSTTGRSKNFREKSIGLPDPGAVSVSILLQGLYEASNAKI